MIDSIRFEIHGINRRMFSRIKKSLDSHLIVNNESGEIFREITKGYLVGSYDYRICVQWKTQRYAISRKDTEYNIGKFNFKNEELSTPVHCDCRPFLLVEFSLAKFHEGVNFLNSSIEEDLQRLFLTRDKKRLCFRSWLEKITNSILPPVTCWKLQRLDCAECFNFYNNDNIINYINLLRNLTYPRRKKPTFWHDSLYITGTTTTVKLYNKHPEFKKHDFPRLKGVFRDKIIADRLLDMTYGLLRYEVEFKRKKLVSLGVFTVNDICLKDWGAEMKKEFFKLIDGAKTSKIFRQNEVEEMILHADLTKKDISAPACLAIWTSIVLNGKNHANKVFGRMKVWRACSVFKMLNINTLGYLEEDQKQPALKLVENNLFAYNSLDPGQARNQYQKVIGYN